MAKEIVFASHPEDDTLEKYCMGRLDEGKIATVEEHLLACGRCQDWVNEHEDFLTAARTAAQEVRQEQKYRQQQPAPKRNWFLQPGWLAGAAVAAALVVTVPLLRTPADVQTVSLSSFRGEPGGGVAQAGHPLQLKLDLRGVSAAACCVIEIADSAGRIVARGEAEAREDAAEFAAPELRAGQYWVRVKSKSGEALRESGLVVR